MKPAFLPGFYENVFIVWLSDPISVLVCRAHSLHGECPISDVVSMCSSMVSLTETAIYDVSPISISLNRSLRRLWHFYIFTETSAAPPARKRCQNGLWRLAHCYFRTCRGRPNPDVRSRWRRIQLIQTFFSVRHER